MAKKDYIAMGPETDVEGQHAFVRQHPDGSLSAGVIGPPVPSGRPLPSRALCLKHDKGPFFEVISEHRVESKGPAKVATDAYRSGWDDIFGKTIVGEA